jgi:Aldo/keto reductase family
MGTRDRLVGGPLGFGAAPLANMFRELTDEEAAATVDAAWQQGTRFFDTALQYGAWRRQRIVAVFADHTAPQRQPTFSFADSGLREVSPAADRRNDCVVSLKDKIVELSAGDGAQKVKLVVGIGSGEDVQRPVPYRGAPQMRVVKTCSWKQYV